MGKAETTLEIPLEISDVSGQKVFSVANAPTSNTVGELVHEMLGKMNLPRNDASGAPLTYQARLEREGRHLNASERIGDALERGDRLTLQPNIDAGLGGC
ncbi:MAG: hypothetical protein ABSC48_09980 [Terracidiphilus sp.]|jgi:hypothetical protein